MTIPPVLSLSVWRLSDLIRIDADLLSSLNQMKSPSNSLETFRQATSLVGLLRAKKKKKKTQGDIENATHCWIVGNNGIRLQESVIMGEIKEIKTFWKPVYRMYVDMVACVTRIWPHFQLHVKKGWFIVQQCRSINEPNKIPVSGPATYRLMFRKHQKKGYLLS